MASGADKKRKEREEPPSLSALKKRKKEKEEEKKDGEEKILASVPIFGEHQKKLVDGVEGCLVIPDFITEEEEKRLLKSLNQEEWMHPLKRRVQHYGYKYDYTSKKITKDDYLGLLPDWSSFLIPRFLENNLFLSAPDQLIVNEYEPGQGISPHIDRVQIFGPRIISVSLGSPTVMELISKEKTKKSLVLPRRSLLLLTGEARFKWKHGIPARQTDNVTDSISGKQMKIIRMKRVSLTFRNMILREE
eukprot:CAMPEP_0201510026 /NCGR_PEP_ID=MMETSP0161_2-20130828/2891_1 /ASSEMBLY_ACC=CAM_ASM_000251 /TAXON_ID=180227 /ORGANISM="Neoparamoeba aestuarina, Strain SoJaBio B1-5/56/2" /LENGTH=246 /DNA_ID=CAMNT_0047905141 /DNA_START=801 /DNA_END=1541 /DNA_ORIENTATION=+